MPKSHEIREGKKYSNTQSAPDSATTVPYRKFKIEVDAKNTAYYFIMSHNLLDEFAAFCKSYHSSDPHMDCIAWLLSNVGI